MPAAARPSAPDLRRRGGLARLAAVAGIVALLLQGAMITAGPLALPTGRADEATALPLCGIVGPVANRDTPSIPNPRHLGDSCPLCLAVHQNHLLPPPLTPGVLPPLRGGGAIVLVEAELVPLPAAIAGVQARAPPVGV